MIDSAVHRYSPQRSSRSVFHVKHRRRIAAFTFALLTALLLVGCGHLAGPEGWAAPIAEGDLIFVQLERGTITAGTLSDSGDLTQRWHFPTQNDDIDLKAIYATPIVDAGVLYLAAFDGSVIAIDTNNGRPLWPATLNVGSHIVATPAFDQNHLYVATENGEIVIVRRDIGTEANRYFDGSGRIWSQPVIVGDTLYLGEFDGRKLAGINLTSGSLVWDQSLDGGVSANLSLASGRIIAGSLDRTLYAYDIARIPTKAWTFNADGWIVANPLPVGNTIYVATLGGSVYAIDSATGREIWKFHQLDSDLQFRSQPALLGGMLVVADSNGGLRGLDPLTGAPRWERDLNDTQLLADPLVHNSRLLFVTRDGQLLLVNPADGSVIRKQDGEA
jgi:outer membrane protein assembly factor BamB